MAYHVLKVNERVAADARSVSPLRCWGRRESDQRLDVLDRDNVAVAMLESVTEADAADTTEAAASRRSKVSEVCSKKVGTSAVSSCFPQRPETSERANERATGQGEEEDVLDADLDGALRDHFESEVGKWVEGGRVVGERVGVRDSGRAWPGPSSGSDVAARGPARSLDPDLTIRPVKSSGEHRAASPASSSS